MNQGLEFLGMIISSKFIILALGVTAVISVVSCLIHMKVGWINVDGFYISKRRLKHAGCPNTTRFHTVICLKTKDELGVQCLMCGKKFYFTEGTKNQLSYIPLGWKGVKFKKDR